VDIVLEAPSLKDIYCILSFVRVGGKTHAYLRHRSNEPVWINDKPQYNAQLKDHDKVRIGDVVFEVHTRDK
jgi:predicted component of type VI protein secretion system